MSIFSRLFKSKQDLAANSNSSGCENILASLNSDLEKLIKRNSEALASLSKLECSNLPEAELIERNTIILSKVQTACTLIDSKGVNYDLLAKLLNGNDLEDREYDLVESLAVDLDGLQNWQREVERNLTFLAKIIKEIDVNHQQATFSSNINRDKTIVDLDREALIKELGK